MEKEACLLVGCLNLHNLLFLIGVGKLSKGVERFLLEDLLIV